MVLWRIRDNSTFHYPFFFSWRYNPHWGVVFYSLLAGFSLLAYEVS